MGTNTNATSMAQANKTITRNRLVMMFSPLRSVENVHCVRVLSAFSLQVNRPGCHTSKDTSGG
jgi:hypothetical protein